MTCVHAPRQIRAHEIAGSKSSTASEQLVDSAVLVAPTLPTGAASVIPLVNWSDKYPVCWFATAYDGSINGCRPHWSVMQWSLFSGVSVICLSHLCIEPMM